VTIGLRDSGLLRGIPSLSPPPSVIMDDCFAGGLLHCHLLFAARGPAAEPVLLAAGTGWMKYVPLGFQSALVDAGQTAGLNKSAKLDSSGKVSGVVRGGHRISRSKDSPAD
jgi:hypothetical protein